MTTTGHSEEKVHVNDIGSPYLHKHHKVAIKVFTKSNVGRAIVLDQHIIDVLFLEDSIDARQHNVCNKYLGMISKSGCHVSPPDLTQILSTSKYYLAPLPRSCILIGVQRTITNIVGGQKEKVFWRLMTTNPKKIGESDINVVKECSDALLNYWYISQESPASLFQQALINQS
tara:strand:+ start:1772 stop:2290 length:519 start_codon:yes stop_codon:yes gene_type:complete